MAKVLASLVRFAAWTVAAAALLVAVRFLTAERLDESIRAHFEQLLAEHYEPRGLRVSVQSARRLGAEGIEIRGVRLWMAGGSAREPLAQIDEMVAVGRTSLAELAQRRPEFHQLVFRRVHLAVEEEPDGSWSVERLFPPPQLAGLCPQVKLESATFDLRVGSSSRPLRVRDVYLRAAPQAPPADSRTPPAGTGCDRWRIAARLASEHFERMDLEVAWDVAAGQWAVQGQVSDLQVSPQLYAMIPERLGLPEAGAWSGLYASSDATFELSSDGSGAAPRFRVSGRIASGRLDPQAFPLPLTDLRALYYADNELARVDRLTARSGRTTLQATFQGGWRPDAPLQAQLSARHLALDWQLVDAFPEALREVWRSLSPAGIVDVDLLVGGTRQRPDWDVTVDCRDVSLSYYKFPYRLDGGRGRVRLAAGKATVEGFRASASGQVVRLDASVDYGDGPPSGWIEASTDGPVPLDGRLLGALDQRAQVALRQLHPAGSLVLKHARLEFDAPELPVRKQLEIQFVNGSIRHDRFPYTIDGIRGLLVVTDSGWEFHNFQGYNDSAAITCSGSWTARPGRPGGRLALEFTASDVLLEDELRDGLPLGVQRIWSEFRPRGTLDQLSVSLVYDDEQPEPLKVEARAQKWPPQGHVERQTITLEPRSFPYRLDQVTGTLTYRNGQLRFEQVKARHGQTSIHVAGAARVLADRRWVLEVSELMVDRLHVDHDFLRALPPRASQALADLELRGPLAIRHSQTDARPALRLQGASPGPGEADGEQQPAAEPLAADWDVTVELYDASLRLGTRIENIHGGVRLVGASRGSSFVCRGHLDIDSVFCHGVQVHQLRGPLYIDPARLALGGYVPAERDQASRPMSGWMLGGRLQWDATAELDDGGQFELLAQLRDAQLEQIAREMGLPQQKVAGLAFGRLRLHGERNRLHTLRGEASVQLRNADIYELPLMVALLKTLTLQRPDTTAFTNSSMAARIEGDRIYFDYIDFQGDAISLKGRGEMDTDRQVEFRFYTVVGREERVIKPLQHLLGEAGKQILEIHVVGSLDQPNIKQTAFPRLNETLQQLFPELARPAASSPRR